MTTPLLQSRHVAVETLHAILVDRRPLDDMPQARDLPPRDRGFARLLVLTVLRRLGQIDDILRRCLDDVDRMNKQKVMNVMRIGVAQLLFLGTPPHAAVDTGVQLAVIFGAERMKGLVNAILRRIDREGREWVPTQDAAKLNTPEWLWNLLIDDWGEERVRKLAEAQLEEAPLDLTVKNPAEAEEWAAKLSGQALSKTTIRREASGGIPTLPGFAEGAWWVQDGAAALPALAMGDIRDKVVFDLCAAPGGKTAQLVAAGAKVTAVEREQGRMLRLKDNLQRLDLAAELVCADITTWKPPGLADAILLDAPCSATGTIRRHPDIALLKRPADIRSLAELQTRLLDHVVDMVKPGGTLVYATCSIQREEGEDQITRLLAQASPKVSLDTIRPEEVAPWGAFATRRGWFRSLPEPGGIDGFFIARMIRK